MILGVFVTILALIILQWQFKKTHESRNVVILFGAFVLAFFGLWVIFDWIIVHIWLS